VPCDNVVVVVIFVLLHQFKQKMVFHLYFTHGPFYVKHTII